MHEESSQIAKSLLDRLLDPAQPRYDFVYDANMSKNERARAQFSRWKQAGYEIQLVGVTIDPQQAKERAVIRGKKSGRWVPSSALVEAHRGFNANIKSYFDAVDKVYFYDNTLAAPQIIAKKLNLPGKLRLPTPNCGVLMIEERIVESLLGKSRLFQKGFKFPKVDWEEEQAAETAVDSLPNGELNPKAAEVEAKARADYRAKKKAQSAN